MRRPPVDLDRQPPGDELRILSDQPVEHALLGEADNVEELAPQQLASAAADQVLRRRIDLGNRQVRGEQDQRESQSGNLVAQVGLTHGFELLHAARRRRNGS